ncbi:hypothetical protein [uncultured Paraglaciecola sp.]|uniref:hypothetical protein n=1 Tax=uncultured Paraglaciecola sp. TaxID=1765024 RepID=UPI002615C50C|nr:hypothetical protein [uncultured Paraglaciecola sp.]
MNDTINNSGISAPKWFLILAVVMVIWNLLGVMAFVMQMLMTPEQIAALPDKEQMLYQDIPLWVNIAFGCAVIGGALGCIALTLKKAIALPILVISLAGVSVQMFHAFFMAKTFEIYGPGAMVMPIMVIVIAIYLVWLANSAKSKGWIA